MKCRTKDCADEAVPPAAHCDACRLAAAKLEAQRSGLAGHMPYEWRREYLGDWPSGLHSEGSALGPPRANGSLAGPRGEMYPPRKRDDS
jgi:hypothetical protein